MYEYIYVYKRNVGKYKMIGILQIDLNCYMYVAKKV